MTKRTFVTGANENYFPLLLELIHSITRFEESKGIDICVMDTGMTSEQIKTLDKTSSAIKIIAPEWPDAVPQNKIRGRTYLKSCVCRPFIPDIFPGYDQYIWLDADTWVQSWDAAALLIEGAERDALTIVPQINRAYPYRARMKWLGPLPYKPRSFYYSNAKKAFSGKVARKLYSFATLNAGVFSLSAQAPHWVLWQKLLRQALKKGKLFTAEQLALGMVVYLEEQKAEFLPSWCNWMHMKRLLWDSEKSLFTEPYLPHTPIGIMHLSGLDDMRVDRSIKVSLETDTGETRHMSLRYPYFNGETGEPISPPAK